MRCTRIKLSRTDLPNTKQQVGRFHGDKAFGFSLTGSPAHLRPSSAFGTFPTIHLGAPIELVPNSPELASHVSSPPSPQNLINSRSISVRDLPRANVRSSSRIDRWVNDSQRTCSNDVDAWERWKREKKKKKRSRYIKYIPADVRLLFSVESMGYAIWQEIS